MEEWRDVPGYEGKYQISISTKEGKCRSLNFHREKRVKELVNTVKKDGYIYWGLRDGKKQIRWTAARWIALTYPELVQNEWFEGAEIDHIDTDRINNQPSNLRWVTPKENTNNPFTLKHISETHKGENCYWYGKHLSDEHKKKLSTSIKLAKNKQRSSTQS